MPLVHQPGSDDVAAQEVFRPTAAVRPVEKSEESEIVKHKPDPGMLADKAVVKMKAKVEVLRKANASAQMIQRAEGRVREAELDFVERQAVKLNAQRDQALEAQKAIARDRISRETIYRMGDHSQVALKIVGGLLVTFFLDKNMSAVARETAAADVARAIEIQVLASERMAHGVATNRPYTVDVERLEAEISHACRRSLKSGDLQFSRMGD